MRELKEVEKAIIKKFRKERGINYEIQDHKNPNFKEGNSDSNCFNVYSNTNKQCSNNIR